VAPAWQALVSVIVGEEQLSSAFGLMQSASALAGVLGPVIGGLLYATWGFTAALTADAVSFGALALIAASLSVDRVPSSEKKSSSWREVTAGLRVIATNARLRAIMILIAALVLTVGVVNVVEIYFVTTNLGAGPISYGLLGLSFGVGSLSVGVFSGAIAQRFPRPERLFCFGCLTICFMMIGFSFVRTMFLAVPISLGVGAGNALINVNAMVLFSSSTPAEIRGRVFSSLQAAISTCSIVAMVIGGLALTWAAPSTVIFCAGLVAVVAVGVTIRPVVRQSLGSDTEGQSCNFSEGEQHAGI
jgi:MFS family permease